MVLNEPLLTNRELREILKISRNTLEQWVRQGEIKTFKCGNVKRYFKSSVDKFINERSTK
jgi:excisionase family DNA binding protein